MADKSKTYKVDQYRDGGEGMIAWCEDNLMMPVTPEGEKIATWHPFNNLPSKPNEYGKSYQTMWDSQCEVLKEALAMVNGEFLHTLLVLIWMRGEGKSALACLIQLWKFFCFPRQRIILAANSKDQVVFAHYDIMCELILNSPKLLAKIGKNNIQIKEIRIKDSKGVVSSYIRTVSSFSGLKPNLTGYTFSEMFEQKSPRFFSQIDGSTRNTPNALGVIDSTVSDRHHQLFKLYETHRKGKDPTLFVSYRFSKPANVKDFWHPRMTAKQLNAKKERFMLGEFERYFENTWSAGAERVFTDEMVEAANYLGIDHQLNVHPALMEILTRKNKLVEQENKMIRRAGDPELDEQKGPAILSQLESSHANQFEEMDRRLWPVSDIYELRDKTTGRPAMATMKDLEALSDLYDTNWAILAGMDRADPMKTTTAARTIVSCVAKGLAGSRSNPFPVDEKDAPRYLYVLLHLDVVEDHSIEVVKDILIRIKQEFDSIDAFGTERWGAVDLVDWCDAEHILPVIYYPTYSRQRAMFTELFIAFKNGRFKTPPVWIPGYKEEDILKEEMKVFDHNPDARRGKFGSPEKFEKYGRQDDVMFSVGSAVYAGLTLGVESFRERLSATQFGFVFQGDGLLGDYR